MNDKEKGECIADEGIIVLNIAISQRRPLMDCTNAAMQKGSVGEKSGGMSLKGQWKRRARQ